ncbi:MAG: hypothetical protein U0324_46075 [Polyangiales bacterium]
MRRPVCLAALLVAACTRTPAPPAPRPAPAPPADASPAARDAASAPDVYPAPDAPAPTPDAVAAPAPRPNGPCRSALAMPAPATDAATSFAPRPPTAPAVLRACAAQAELTRARLAPALRSMEAGGRRAVVESLTPCADAGDGAWTFDVSVRRPREASVPGTRVYPVDLRAVYVAADGATRVAAAGVTLAVSGAQFAHTVSAAEVGVFDWDGDGRAELFFRELHEQEESGNEAARQNRWWAFAAPGAEAPREFAPEAARAVAIRDVDVDGRPDLELRSPWVAVGPCGIADVDNFGPTLVLHSVAGGRFVEDEVSHAWLARQCPERTTHYFRGLREDGMTPVARQPQTLVACARIYGDTAAEVAARVARTWPTGPDGGQSPAWCFPREELVRVARVDPPGAFRLSCDPPR